MRLKREKENEKKDQEIFEKILEEAKNNHYKPQSIRTKISNTEEVMPTMKISERKAQSILEKGGMLDAYKYLIAQLCKNGLPTGNLFDYSAYVIQSYEKKWKEKKSKEAKEKEIQFVYKSTNDNTFLEADREEIKKVVINLLNHAIVYSSRGEKIVVCVENENNNLKYKKTYVTITFVLVRAFRCQTIC